jgi:hypothetical protein
MESLDGSRFLSSWLQGFTNNVSSGGICLTINNFDHSLSEVIKKHEARVSLEIELPISKKPIIAKASVAWIRNVSDTPNRYLIGLAYDEIDKNQNSRIMRYALMRKILIPAGLGLVILLGLAIVANGLINMKLIQGNKALVQQLVGTIQDSNVAKEKVAEISREREELRLKIQDLELRISSAEAEKTRLGDKDKAEIDEYSRKLEGLNNLLYTLSQEKNALKEQLDLMGQKENVAVDELSRLDRRRATLEKANADKMYEWVKVHQNPRTGLVMSFEGDSDIKGWAFIYDQSLAAQVYTYYSDFGASRKVLDFFRDRAKKKDGLFFNAYYVLDGEPAEYIIHSGPNIWIGLAIAQYTYKAQDTRYLALAEELAQAIMKLQNHDSEGGIRGGPDASWYATEHNLDAYAFFNMLYRITGKEKYADCANKVLSWLVKHTYDKPGLPIKRGKGDSTIATDTYAWSIAAIGPEKLERLGMSPDRIMEFAESNCAVQVDYSRPEGRVIKVKGFDFAPQRHVARGGVVSSEWTAQMVISFKIMEEFYSQKGMTAKARGYKNKADEYLSSLGNMIISSPSPSGQGESCLPYATQEFVDTGHGWLTPKGKSTGSLAGTAYTFFAHNNYNPLELKIEE